MSLDPELKSITDGIGGFVGWGHAEKIRFFAWFQHAIKKKDSFTTADISACYDGFGYERPNISQFLKDMAERKPAVLLRRGSGFVMEGKTRAEYEQKYGTHDITLNIRQKVKDLINKVPDVAEKDFMVEADICLRHDAGRATIIMVWNVAFYHLCQFILKHHLAKFNAGFQKHYAGLWQQAKVKTMASYDDFSTLKESVVIDICKRENIINQNVAKILEKRLGDRNSAAHPSTIHVGQLQAEAFIEDIVDNVVLALNI